MAFVHNLIVWKVWKLNNVDPRKTPYLAPHGTEIMGYHDCPCGNVSYFNNIFTRAEMTEYDDCVLPVQMEKTVIGEKRYLQAWIKMLLLTPVSMQIFK